MMVSQKCKYFVLVIVSTSLFSSLYSVGDKMLPYGYDPYGSRLTPGAAKTQMRISALKEMAECASQLKKLETAEERDESEIEIQRNLLSQWERIGRGMTLPDAIFNAFIGSELADALQSLDLNAAKNPLQAINAAILIKTSEVGGNAIFKDVLEKRIGGLVGSGLDKFGNGISFATRFFYKTVTGRSGDPFSYDDISVSKKAVGDMLNMLLEAGRKAANLGNRDKILRLDDNDEGAIDPLWLAMRTLTVNKFKMQADLINYSLEYYKKDENSRISLYANQISDGLNVLIEYVLMPTKSYKDLGEGSSQNALLTLRKSIDSDYDSLLKNLPSSETSSLMTDPVSKRQDSRDRDPGMNIFNNSGI
jgi:hypothetical protein